MQFALVLRYLLSRRRLLLLGALVAAVVAILSVYRLDGFNLKARSIVYSAASTQVLIDTPSSVLGNVNTNPAALQTIATVYANFMASPAVLALIGNHVGLRGDQLYAAGPVDPNVPRTVQEPTALQRNVELTGESTPYRLGFTADPNLPEVGIYTQAPTTNLAVALANASVVALTDYVSNLENTERIPSADRVVIRPLGSAVGAVVDPGIAKSLAALVFVAVFVLWCCLMLSGSKLAATWKASGRVTRARQTDGLTYDVMPASDEVLLAASQVDASDAGRPGDGEPAGDKAKNGKAASDKPVNGKHVNGKQVDDKPAVGKTADAKPASYKPTNPYGPVIDEAPANDTRANGTPVSDTTVNKTPVGATPVDGEPVDGKPVDEKPADGKPADGKPVDGKPVDEKPVSDKPVSEKPVSEKRRRRAPAAQAVREVEEHLAHRQKV
jgi:hypothetical protein